MANGLQKYTSSQYRVFWHILFWIAYWVSTSLIYGSLEENYTESFQWELLYIPGKIIATYFTLYVILPRFFLERKYVISILMFLVTIILGALMQRALDYTIIYPLFDRLDWMQSPFWLPAKILKSAIGVYPVVALAAFVKLAKHWYNQEKEARELSSQKLEAELNFLKAQIHPHFLFNTLNNLYALTLKKSDNSPEIVLKLSDLLSYMLYECNSRLVSLKKELSLIENYISLEKIRYGDRLKIDYKTKGTEKENLVPPMLLLPFVENAFKHGTSEILEDAWVNISIDITETQLLFDIENSNGHNDEAGEQEYQKGIGLNNVKRRLELLYEDGYTLNILDNPSSYHVNLVIDLDQYKHPSEQ